MRLFSLFIGRKAVSPTEAPTEVPSDIAQSAALRTDDAPTGSAPLPVTAKDLWRAFNDNQVAAEILYADRLLLVTGEVDHVDRDFKNRIRVNLRTSSYNVLHAFFPDEARDEVASLRPDQSVRLLARVKEADCGKVALEAEVGAA